ncbi:uncharacterized protein si:ch73-100l22.3 isoform X2 [Mugil cephalus]|uniref:uncharacterized protein si:ch73-100l22.3 isoform X2 n=1 Tax=Mugil cephalus TaxID=48193 RepID=UPI001FB5B1E1|nr:uncharacterized protein si:ch73-100l22.3 isoform X2 [Mugil cephalus]
MENYETFVQHRLSEMKKSEEEGGKPLPASSLIRFYGRPILPPLLSRKQREEMQRHRNEVQKASTQKKLKDDARMAHVKAILHSIQLRTTPTLEELLRETELDTQSSYSHNSSRGSVSQGHVFGGTNDRLSPPPPPVKRGENDASLPPLTSTTYSAFFASNVTPQNYERCLIDHQGSQPSYCRGGSHQPLSLGYVTSENVENATNISEWNDAESDSRGFGSANGVHNLSGFFLHTTSNTIAKMPDIISHPPIDGEELERSGLERSFCDNLIGVKDVCCISLQEDSAICDPLPAEQSGSSFPDSVEVDAESPLMTILDSVKGGNLDQNEGSAALLEEGVSSGSTELLQVLNSRLCLTAGQDIQHNHREAEPAESPVDEGDSKPPEKPYRLSLQALLKKSQEYRRRHRMLRNQAKNTKFQDRTQEQPRERAEEQSLSDKENDEFPDKVTVTVEGKKVKERGNTVMPSMEISPKKSWEDEKTLESECTGNKMNIESENSLTQDENKVEQSSEDQTALKNKLNSSQEGIIKPKSISPLIQQQSAGTSRVQDAFYVTTSTRSSSQGTGKYCCLPAPNFCRSPVHSKSKDSTKDGEDDDDRQETSDGKYEINIGLNEDHKAEDDVLGHENIPSTVNLTIDEDVTNVLAKSSQHIDQLESNLCSLKELISDLESTVKENMDSQCQSEFTFKDIKQTRSDQHVQPSPDACEDDDEEEEECKVWPERLSFKNPKNLFRGSGQELSITDNVRVTEQEKVEEMVNMSELRLVKTVVTEREKGEGTGTDGLTKSSTQHGGWRKQQPLAKHVQSVTQRMRIPCVFRNVSSETAIPLEVPVHSDTSSHVLLRRNEMAIDVQNRSPSLNESYDVDTPSGLWLVEAPGSDLDSQDRLIQKNHLTPESEGEGQGGVSKVKRRLLMHVTDEAPERSADTSEGGGSVIRPNSSAPRESRYEGHGSQKDKQEQLKLAHAAQVKALQDEHRKQQEELLQPCSSPSQRYRPLLSAAVKGFLTRRLLRTERVAQLVRTIRDTHQFLQQIPGKEELCSRQDVLLQERVTLQLRAARYEVYDIFFSLTARERMQLISWDRELAREKKLRLQSGHAGRPRGQSSLSAATQKSLERKRGTMIQKKAAERHRGVTTRTGPKPGSSAEQPLGTKRGQCRANPQRVPKSTFSSRPR